MDANPKTNAVQGPESKAAIPGNFNRDISSRAQPISLRSYRLSHTHIRSRKLPKHLRTILAIENMQNKIDSDKNTQQYKQSRTRRPKTPSASSLLPSQSDFTRIGSQLVPVGPLILFISNLMVVLPDIVETFMTSGGGEVHCQFDISIDRSSIRVPISG